MRKDLKMSEENKTTDVMSEEDSKKLKQIKVGYSLAQFGGGIEKAFYSTYSSYFYTNVYMMPTVYAGLLTIISSIVGWVGNPVFGAIVDKVKFKNARYWPWFIIGSVIYNLSWIGIYLLPALGVKGSGAAIIALILACIAQVGAPLMTVPMNASFPLLSSDPKDRQFFGQAQKVGRDGAKTIFGYIFPAVIAAWTLSMAGGEAAAYAYCVLIAGIPPIITYIYYALVIKDSYVERKALASTGASTKKGSISLITMFKTVFTNRPLLSMYLWMSLHKIYYFLYVTCASYMFRYVFGDFGKMKFFMTLFNLTAVIGVMFGPAWRAVFKETKRCFVSAFIVHLLFTAAIAVTFTHVSLTVFLVLFGCSSLFMGLLENYMLPMFAASADYGAWKAGKRMDGISMSIYSLTVKTGTLFAATIRTAVLAKAGLDAVVATGEVTADFVAKASTLFTWWPLGLGLVALLVLIFGFNLNDERIAYINKEIAEGRTAAESDKKF